MKSVKHLSLCGHWLLEKDWFSKCVATFPRLLKGEPWHVLSDGTLKEDDFKILEDLSKCEVIAVKPELGVVEEALSDFPALAQVRERTKFIRRLIDVTTVFDRNDTVLSFDTDVYFRGNLTLPERIPNFAYCVDEVPGYSGNVRMALFPPILRALNGGFLLYRIQDVDFDMLEGFARDYLSKSKIPWWSEQSIFALLGARVSGGATFDPKQIDIVSGLQKRSEAKRLSNQTTYVSNFRKQKATRALLEKRITSAHAIHFAGPGKPWIEFAETLEPHEGDEIIRFMESPTISLSERLLLAGRIGMQQLMAKKSQ